MEEQQRAAQLERIMHDLDELIADCERAEREQAATIETEVLGGVYVVMTAAYIANIAMFGATTWQRFGPVTGLIMMGLLWMLYFQGLKFLARAGGE